MSGSGFAKRVVATLALCTALLLATEAAARSITVRWRFAEPERAAGFRVHVGVAPGLATRTIDVGKPPPDRDGVYRVEIEVDESGPVFVSVSAYGERGEESPRSNESVRAPEPGEPPAAERLGTPGRPRVVRP